MFDECERICSLNCDENGDKLHFLAHLGLARKAMRRRNGVHGPWEVEGVLLSGNHIGENTLN